MEASFVPGSDHHDLQEGRILQMRMTVYYKRTAQEPWTAEEFDSEAKMPHERELESIAAAFEEAYRKDQIAALRIEYK